MASMLFAEDCEMQAIMLLSSFAAPLMSLHPSSRSALVQWVKDEPGSGSGTALMAAQTVWGKPDGLTVPASLSVPAKRQAIDDLDRLPVTLGELDRTDPLFRDMTLRYLVENEGGHPTIGFAIRRGEGGMRKWDRGYVVSLKGQIPYTVSKEDPDKMSWILVANRGCAGKAFIDAIQNPRRLYLYMRDLCESLIGSKREQYPQGAYWWSAVNAAIQIVLAAEILEFDPKRIQPIIKRLAGLGREK